MNKMEQAQSRMLISYVFLATVLMRTRLRRDDTIPTAATDYVSIMYNPQFIEAHSVRFAMFVLAHEVFHIILKHNLRACGRNRQLWNIACDHAINLQLKAWGFEIWDKCCCDAKYIGWSEEKIYDDLAKNQDPDDMPDQGGMSGDIKDDGKPLSPEDKKEIEAYVDQTIAAAATAAKAAGQMTADLERLVGALMAPKIPWTHYLHEYMSNVKADEESWAVRDRRFPGMYLPGRYSESMGEVIMIGDTSGSVSAEDITRLASEVKGMCDEIRPERIRMVWCDTKVQGEQVFEEGEEIDLKPKGFGGTDMRVGLEHVAQYEPLIVVLITDGYTPWPDRDPPYPLIVVCTTDTKVPIGQVVRMKEHG